jgi:hypothetical protein
MRKMMIKVLMLACVVLFASMAFAEGVKVNDPAKQDREPRFKPTLSVGYAFLGDTSMKFVARGGTFFGVGKIDLKVPSVSGLYLAGELPFALTDRLTLTLGGRWAFSGSSTEATEVYNSGIALRNWDSDDRDWVTADLLLSYAFVKNVFFLRDISGVLGFRWDYQKVSFDDPQAQGVLSLPTDTITFRMNTYSPVLGLTSTIKGFKYGIFGGDIKLGGFGSPIAWGNMKYTEEFAQTTRLRFDDDLNRVYYFNVLGEITALSGKIGSGVEASLSIFAQYTKFFVKDNPTGKGQFGGVGLPAATDFHFTMRPNLTTVGIKASAAF